MVMRLSGRAPLEIEIRSNGRVLGKTKVDEEGWHEYALPIDAREIRERLPLEVVSTTGDTFDSFHYWFYQAETSPELPADG